MSWAPVSKEPSQPALVARGVCASYGARAVLHEVNMAAHRGEVLGIIGPNGAGKSTLLKALSGAIPVSTGAVSILGRDLARFRPRELARTLAYVPQSEPTLFDFTAREVVLMGRHPHSRRSSAEADAAAVAAAMVSTDTLHLGDRPITALSGGEHRRVILARAIAQQPIVMLLDEPTAHLDVTHQAEILGLLARMTRTDGLAAVAALHDLNVASEYCDRLLLIVRGRVVVEGPPHVVLANDTLASAYGARFHIAANPVTARPLVIPNVVPSAQSPGAREATIHLVCGGGTGAPAMVELSRAGYLVTAGVLNRRDTDEEASRALRLACACEEPFSPVTEARLSEAYALAEKADVVIVCPIPVGHGNLANLDLARRLRAAGKRLVLLGGPTIGARDFTNGAAAEAWGALAAQADVVADADEPVVPIVRRILSDRPGHDSPAPTS